MLFTLDFGPVTGRWRGEGGGGIRVRVLPLFLFMINYFVNNIVNDKRIPVCMTIAPTPST